MSSFMTKKLRKRFLYPFLRLTQLVNDQGDLGWRVGTLVVLTRGLSPCEHECCVS